MDSQTDKIEIALNLVNKTSLIVKRLDSTLGSIHGIGFTEYMVLFHLNQSYNQTMRRIDLANSIGLTASGITRIVSPMEKIGVVMKEQNPRDARVSLVKMTPAGEDVFTNATLSIQQNSARLLSGVNADSLTCALTVFKALGNDTYV